MRKFLFLALLLFSGLAQAYQAYYFRLNPYEEDLYKQPAIKTCLDNANALGGGSWCNIGTANGAYAALIAYNFYVDSEYFTSSCPYPDLVNINTGACIPHPTDYECESPKQWVSTNENDWRCADITLIPLDNTPNKGGVYGTPGNYHTGTFNSSECDSDIPYECIIPNCEFWNPLSLINALCN